jgi:hypothetical protein
MEMTSSAHVYEVHPRKDKRGVDLISDALPCGRLWYGEPNAVNNAVGYAMHCSRSHDAVIRVYDDAGNVIETHETPVSSKSREHLSYETKSRHAVKHNGSLLRGWLTSSSDYSEPFAVQVCSVEAGRSLFGGPQ